MKRSISSVPCSTLAIVDNSVRRRPEASRWDSMTVLRLSQCQGTMQAEHRKQQTNIAEEKCGGSRTKETHCVELPLCPRNRRRPLGVEGLGRLSLTVTRIRSIFDCSRRCRVSLTRHKKSSSLSLCICVMYMHRFQLGFESSECGAPRSAARQVVSFWTKVVTGLTRRATHLRIHIS